MKICPTCQKQWALAFKFCPEDATTLQTVEAAQNADPTEPDLPRAVQHAGDTGRKAARSEAAPAKPVMPEPASRRSSRPKTTQEWSVTPPPRAAQNATQATVSDLPAVKHEREARSAPTVVQTAAVTPDLLEAAKKSPPAKPVPAASPAKPAPAAKPAKPVAASPAKAAPVQPAPTAPDKGAKAAGKRPGFSETAWFMKAVDPSAVDPETGKVAVDEQRYQRDTTIPEEKRRRFSLGSKNEE